MTTPLARVSCYVPQAELGSTQEFTRAEAAQYLDSYCSTTQPNTLYCDFFRQTFFSNTPKATDLTITFQQNAKSRQTEVDLLDTKDECASPENPDIFTSEIVPLHLTGTLQPSEDISPLQLRSILKQLQTRYQLQDPTLQAALLSDSTAREHPLGKLVLNQLAYMNALQFSFLDHFSRVYAPSNSARLRNFDDPQYAPSNYTPAGEISALLTFPQASIARVLSWSSVHTSWAQNSKTIALKHEYIDAYNRHITRSHLSTYPQELLTMLYPSSVDPQKLFADREAFLNLQADWIDPTSDNNFDTHWNATIIALGLATADTEPEEVVGEYVALKNSAQAGHRGFWQNAIFEAWEKTRKPVAVDLVDENQTSPEEARPPQSSAAVTYRADTPL